MADPEDNTSSNEEGEEFEEPRNSDPPSIDAYPVNSPNTADQSIDLSQPPTSLGPLGPRKLVTEFSYSSGPIPPAHEIERYAKAVPNGGDRIFRMAEKEQDHAIEMSRLEINHSIWRSYISQGMVLAIFGGLVYLGFLLIDKGYVGWGLAEITGVMSTLILAFRSEIGANASQAENHKSATE